MTNRKYNIFKSEYLKNVSFIFFFYWLVLVVWQNISGAETRGMADTILKIGLLSLLVIYYLFNFKTVSLKIILVMMVLSTLSITLINSVLSTKALFNLLKFLKELTPYGLVYSVDIV